MWNNFFSEMMVLFFIHNEAAKNSFTGSPDSVIFDTTIHKMGHCGKQDECVAALL